LSFTAYDPKTNKRVPISRNYRRVDAFWNMLSDYGRSVDIVGWLATYRPRTFAASWSPTGSATWPTAAPAPPLDAGQHLARNARRRYRHAALSGDRGRVRRLPALRAGRPSGVRGQSRQAVRHPESGQQHDQALCIDRSYRNIARHLLETDKPDLLAVYFELPDATSHLFMHYAPPRQPETDAAKYEMFKNAVEEAYVLQDEIIGQLMALADDNTVVMLASDHGFRSGASRPKISPEIAAGKAAMWHRLEGIICLYGKGIRAGHRIESASILDIARRCSPCKACRSRPTCPARCSPKRSIRRSLGRSTAPRCRRCSASAPRRRRRSTTRSLRTR
jgi:hypothetical protein